MDAGHAEFLADDAGARQRRCRHAVQSIAIKHEARSSAGSAGSGAAPFQKLARKQPLLPKASPNT